MFCGFVLSLRVICNNMLQEQQKHLIILKMDKRERNQNATNHNSRHSV